jgi:Tfp pilus assembly protein PilO
MKTLRLLLFPAVLLISILLFYNFVIPQWGDYMENKANLEIEQANLEKAKKNKAKFEEIVSDYKSLSISRIDLINNSIPNDFLQENFLYSLNSIISENGLNLKSVNFPKKTLRDLEGSSQEVDENQVNLEIEGNFFQIKKAIFQLESLDRLVEARDISLKKNNKIGNILDAQIELVIFTKNSSIVGLEPKVSGVFFNDILENGLRIDLIDKYQEYKGETDYSDFSWNGEIGKDNIFEVEGGFSEPSNAENQSGELLLEANLIESSENPEDQNNSIIEEGQNIEQ